MNQPPVQVEEIKELTSVLNMIRDVKDELRTATILLEERLAPVSIPLPPEGPITEIPRRYETPVSQAFEEIALELIDTKDMIHGMINRLEV